MGESLYIKFIKDQESFTPNFIRNELLKNGAIGLLEGFQFWLIRKGHLKEVEK